MKRVPVREQRNEWLQVEKEKSQMWELVRVLERMGQVTEVGEILFAMRMSKRQMGSHFGHRQCFVSPQLT